MLVMSTRHVAAHDVIFFGLLLLSCC